jgi:hypothetical protein
MKVGASRRLAERLGEALKDEAELNSAVTRLMKARNA